MSSQKIITVFGATGAQGGSVIRSLQQNKSGDFKLRATTRNPESEAAKALASTGVEVVKADGFNKDELVAAFNNSWGVFVNTNSDDPAFETDENPPREIDLGRIIVSAAAEAHVRHFIYSSMASLAAVTNNEIQSEAFEDKHGIERLARATDAFETVSFIRAGWYYENFLGPEIAPFFGGFPHEPNADGILTYRTPLWGAESDDPLPFIAIEEDYGDLVHGIFLDPHKWDKKAVQAVSDNRNFADVIKVFQETTNKKAVLEPLPSWKDFEAHGVRPIETVKLMYGAMQISGGLYFGEPVDCSAAAELKRAASKAKGLADEKSELASLKGWFGRHMSK